MRNNRCGGLVIDRDGGEQDCLETGGHHCPDCDGPYCDEHWSETWLKCLGCLGVNHRDEIPKRCEGCGKGLGVIEALQWNVCMECTKARARSAFGKGCKCGRKRRPTEVRFTGSRTWIDCHRCLGQIKQLS